MRVATDDEVNVTSRFGKFDVFLVACGSDGFKQASGGQSTAEKKVTEGSDG